MLNCDKMLFLRRFFIKYRLPALPLTLYSPDAINLELPKYVLYTLGTSSIQRITR